MKKTSIKAVFDKIEPSDAAMERLRAVCAEGRAPKKKRSYGFAALKAAGAVAACFMLLVTASVFSPVLAENIPFMDNIVGFLKNSRTIQSDVITQGGVENYITPVADIDEDASFKITESYCDGTALVLGMTAEVPGAPKEMKALRPYYRLAFDGKPYEGGNVQHDRALVAGKGTTMFRAEGDSFAGSLTLDISDLDLADRFTITVTPEETVGIDPTYQVLAPDNPDCYIPKEYELEKQFEGCTVTIDVNTGIRGEYEVNESVEDFTLNRIITTPGFTYLDITQPDSAVYYHTVTDQDGSELEWAPNFAVQSYNKPYYAPIPTGTTAVHVNVYHWEDIREPIEVIEIPVTGGYEIHAVEPKYGQEDVVYDPPLSTLEDKRPPKFHPYPDEKVVPLGETIVCKNTDCDYDSEDDTLEITYSNMQVYDSPEDLSITMDDMCMLYESLYKETENPLKHEGFKFVTFDVHIETNNYVGSTYEDYQAEIDAYDKNDGTAGILFFNTYCNEIAPTTMPERFEEPTMDYFSGHMNGVTNYYHFASNANDTHDFVLGCYVTEDRLASGEWVIRVLSGEKYGEMPTFTCVEIPPVE